MQKLFKNVLFLSIVSGLFCNQVQAYNLSPISFANFYHIAEEGNLQGLKDVQRRGLNLNATNQNGDTAVCVAIKKQDYLAYKTLIRAGAQSHPACLENIPEYAHKAFLNNYNQKYAAPQTPINWTKSGTAFVLGAGAAAGVVALAAGGGGGGGGGSNSDSKADETPNVDKCSINKCAEGCFENKVCSADEICTKYNTCGGCTQCEASSICRNNKCAQGCYKDLICSAGYTCEKTNECGGCESCVQLTECQKNACAKGCYTDLTCPTNYTCSHKNACGGCDQCTANTNPPDTSNATNCLLYDRDNNLCTKCEDGFKLVNGGCQATKPANCKDYDEEKKVCKTCEDGYNLSSNGHKCTKKDETTDPDKPANCAVYDEGTQLCTTCEDGYNLTADKKACSPIGSNCDGYDFTDGCPLGANCDSCINSSGVTKYKIKSCQDNFEYNDEIKLCVTKTCDTTTFPLSKCPNHGSCVSCTSSVGLTLYALEFCENGYNMAEDKKSCTEIKCNITSTPLFPLSECPSNAICGSCTDSEGTHYNFKECNIGYTQTSNNNCVFDSATAPGSETDFVANDKTISLSKSEDFQNEDIIWNDRIIGFTHGDSVNADIYNAKTAPATISIINNDFTKRMIVGMASTGGTGKIFNSYGSKDSIGPKGTIYIKSDISYDSGSGTETHYGIRGNGDVYNSYYGDGDIEVINISHKYIDGEKIETIENSVGILSDSVFNAWGGTGSIKASYMGIQASKDVINAIAGGTGTIVMNNPEFYGHGITANQTVYNAYSTDAAQTTTGTITITAKGGYGIQGYTVYNAYGTNASGNISITAVNNSDYNLYSIFGISALEGANGSQGGSGKISIIDKTGTGLDHKGIIGIKGKTTDINLQPNLYNGGENGEGSIVIETNSPANMQSYGPTSPSIIGISNANNGHSSNGVGDINITDTGGNSIYGIENGNNYYKQSLVYINSVADENQIIIGIINDSSEISSLKNEGSVEIDNDKNSATVIGTIVESSSGKTMIAYNSGEINLKGAGKLYGMVAGSNNSGTITLLGMAKKLTDISNETTGMFLGDISSVAGSRYSFNQLVNSGDISIENAPGTSYGMRSTTTTYSSNTLLNNSGNITIDGIGSFGSTAYGMRISKSDNDTLITNSGNITLTTNSLPNEETFLCGICGVDFTGRLINEASGTISITGNGNEKSTAYGIYGKGSSNTKGAKYIVNDGKIEISLGDANGAGTANAHGIQGQNVQIKNTGTITLTGVNSKVSYGIFALNGSKVYNSGTITINGTSSTSNEANGNFIFIDHTSSMVNEGDITVNYAFDVSLGGGEFVLAKGGKIEAPKISGKITAAADIVAGGFDKTYTSNNAFVGDAGEVQLSSGSALFDASLQDNNIVMTMKKFDDVIEDKSFASYLQRNYEAQKNAELFDELKKHTSAQQLNASINQQFGYNLLPNFAQENMNVFRSLSNLVTDNMFSQDLTNERMMVGYDYLGQDRSSKGRVTGYENTANSSYFLADVKLNNRQRFGLGAALTRFDSDYDDSSSRKATFAQALGSYMHDFGNHWKYAGVARLGYADGKYKRQSGNSQIEGNTSDILYGLNNEMRYTYDLGFMTIEPQLELNASGYYQNKIKEDDSKASAMIIKGTNNLSVESGAGVYIAKETVYGENGKIKGRLGGSYYRELSQPYHTMRARIRDMDGYYLIESEDIFDRNRVIVRADITFSWKALDFYLRGSQFMEDKHTTVINAGIKYNF